MTPQIIDLSGQRFGLLTVVSLLPERKKGKLMWLCRCDCGETTNIAGCTLKGGRSHSCGCDRKQEIARKLRKYGSATARNTKEYRAWQAMINRCRYLDRECSKYHGQRGIRVCEQWEHSFETFLKDVGPCPSPDHSLDRHPNQDGNYEPGNTRWATDEQQARNMRSNRVIEFRGETKILAEWAETLDISYSVLNNRINSRGWDIDRALSTPPLTPDERQSIASARTKELRTKYFTYQGETLSMREWAKRLGINRTTLITRLKDGWTIELALSTPNVRRGPKPNRKPKSV